MFPSQTATGVAPGASEGETKPEYTAERTSAVWCQLYAAFTLPGMRSLRKNLRSARQGIVLTEASIPSPALHFPPFESVSQNSLDVCKVPSGLCCGSGRCSPLTALVSDVRTELAAVGMKDHRVVQDHFCQVPVCKSVIY